MNTVKVSTKGWVVIPKPLRDKYGLEQGSLVQVVDHDGMLALVPLPEDPVAGLRGMLKDGPSLMKGLMVERRPDGGGEKEGRDE